MHYEPPNQTTWTCRTNSDDIRPETSSKAFFIGRNFSGIRYRFRCVFVSAFICAICHSQATPANALSGGMKAPPPSNHHHDADKHEVVVSVPGIFFIGAIDFYRNRISPINPGRCGFSPSCSAFGRQAVKEYGAIKGIMMTADRLTRCNFFKQPGPDYLLLPNGSLLDPVYDNTLDDQ